MMDIDGAAVSAYKAIREALQAIAAKPEPSPQYAAEALARLSLALYDAGVITAVLFETGEALAEAPAEGQA